MTYLKLILYLAKLTHKAQVITNTIHTLKTLCYYFDTHSWYRHMTPSNSYHFLKALPEPCSQYSAVHMHLLLTIQCSTYKFTADNTVQYVYTYCSQYSAVHIHLLLTIQCSTYTLTAHSTVQYIYTYCSQYSNTNSCTVRPQFRSE